MIIRHIKLTLVLTLRHYYSEQHNKIILYKRSLYVHEKFLLNEKQTFRHRCAWQEVVSDYRQTSGQPHDHVRCSDSLTASRTTLQCSPGRFTIRASCVDERKR